MKASVLFLIIVLLSFAKVASSANLTGRIVDYSNYHLEKNEDLARIKDSGNFLGRTTSGGSSIIGWFEYDVVVDAPGWYELFIDYNAAVFGEGWSCHVTEYTVDGRHLPDSPYQVEVGRKKAGNVWMDKGTHKFRFENTNWWSQAPITGYEFKALGANLAQNVRVDLNEKDDYYGGNYYGTGETLPLNIYSGGSVSGTFTVEILRKTNGSVVKRYDVAIAPSQSEQKQTILLSVEEEGSFFCRYKANGTEISKAESLRSVEFTTIDSTPVTIPESIEEVSKSLEYTIDCTSKSPDYQDASSQVVTTALGKYRESGTGNWDYFAYTLPVTHSNEVYIVEVDIPDDKQRGIQVQFREKDPVNYIIGPGVETGYPYKNTNKIVTQRYLYWPRFDGAQPRIAIVNVGTNDRNAPAAVKEIRLYRADGPLPALKTRKDGREFSNWFEEPERWLDPYGAQSGSQSELIRAAENWAKTMRYMGATTMFPTVDVYGMGMYPSKYRYSSRYGGDKFKMLLLVAQKYGLKIMADLNPRMGVLTTKHYNDPDPKRFELFEYDKNGKHYDYNDVDKYIGIFNPAHPEVQLEIKKKMAEFADRYSGQPALTGASLRVMGWQPHTMTFFRNLDWGYGPYTGKAFASYLGIADPGTPQARYSLFTGTYKDQWINWRINVVHDVIRGIRDTCQSINANFQVYSNLQTNDWMGESLTSTTGIDNYKIDGFSYINGLYVTGRKNVWEPSRSNITDSLKVKMVDKSRMHFFGYQYFEEANRSVPNSALGLSGDDSKWISAHLAPIGDYNLERYATAIAQTDAIYMGNGGNTYFIDPMSMREFLADYVVLPKDEFKTLTKDSAVVIRELRGSEYLFYMINKTDEKQQVVLDFCEPGQITRIANGQVLTPDENNQIIFDLEPYHLYSFKSSGLSICSAIVNNDELYNIKEAVVVPDTTVPDTTTPDTTVPDTTTDTTVPDATAPDTTTDTTVPDTTAPDTTTDTTVPDTTAPDTTTDTTVPDTTAPDTTTDTTVPDTTVTDPTTDTTVPDTTVTDPTTDTTVPDTTVTDPTTDTAVPDTTVTDSTTVDTTVPDGSIAIDTTTPDSTVDLSKPNGNSGSHANNGNATGKDKNNVNKDISINVQIDDKPEIKVYPNPTSGLLNFENVEAKAYFFDSYGKLLLCDDVTMDRSSINISYFLTGMYYLKLIFDDGSSHTLKIVKTT